MRYGRAQICARLFLRQTEGNDAIDSLLLIIYSGLN